MSLRNDGAFVRIIGDATDRYCTYHALSVEERERLADRIVQQVDGTIAEIANRAARSDGLHPAQRTPLDVGGGGA